MRVLDMGCGTGVLGILAIKKGALMVTAIDIDEWAYKNTLENIELNDLAGFTVLQGGAELLEGDDEYDLISCEYQQKYFNKRYSFICKSSPKRRQAIFKWFLY